jgi:solute carrier family 25 phosphate transporter 23/24/25/41
MWKTEGMRGLFKGNGANCVRIVPNSAVKFFCYEHMAHGVLDMRRAVDPNAEMDVLTRLAGGAGAGIVAMSATYPLDMIRGRLTVQKGAADGGTNYRGIYHAFTVITQKEGLGAFYKGWTPSVIGVIPYVGLNFAIYETLKDQLVKVQGLNSAKDLSVGAGLVCGGIAGAVGQTVAYPFDVCRRRLQVSGWVQAGVGSASGPVYTGMIDCFRRTVAEEGVSALFHGLSANYVKIMPSIAIAFVVYDQLKIILKPEVHISSGG